MITASHTQTAGPVEALPLPLEALYDRSIGTELPLPPELRQFYGALRFPLRRGKPYVIANLVSSLDGVVSLGIPGQAGGKEISGSNLQDRALMGLLRAAADAVVVGAGTLRESEGKLLTGAKVFPPLAGAYADLRRILRKESESLAVIVTASGDLDPALPIFRGGAEVLVVTTPTGAQRARGLGLPKVVRVMEAPAEDEGSMDHIPARAVLEAIQTLRSCDVVLVEGGPRLLGDFYAEGIIDEQFLTLSPQVVGRDSSGKQRGLVEGKGFAPGRPLWGELSVVKRGESHLFLRYGFQDTFAHDADSKSR
ncbi:MAG TPA: dihydrofolate reductase family protein [Chloroflexia bacterium]|jgi:riboflavin biosynthesis pyrimidine reductase